MERLLSLRRCVIWEVDIDTSTLEGVVMSTEREWSVGLDRCGEPAKPGFVSNVRKSDAFLKPRRVDEAMG